MKISVITPSFNSARYIERAIKSVLNQEYDNWEHIIVDGGSTDGTVDILNKYPHLVWVSEPDKGQSDAMNKGFSISDGNVIMYLNADDYLQKGIFGKVIDIFKSGNVDILVGKLKIQWLDKILYREATSNHFDIIRYWRHKFPANPVSYFYKRDVQVSVGEFPVNDHYTMDYWFLLRAFELFNVQCSKVEFGIFWVDGNNKTYVSDVEGNLKHIYDNYFQAKGFLGEIYGNYLYKSRNYKIRGKEWVDKLICKMLI